jgi:hypothetical protein
MKLIPALAALALVGLALPAAADPLPGMVAYATLQPDGVHVAWRSAGAAEEYQVLRSRGSAGLTIIATVGPGQHAYLDAEGQVTDLYVVNAMAGGQVAVSSNLAPVVPLCPFIDPFNLPPPWIDWQCLPLPRLGYLFHSS